MKVDRASMLLYAVTDRTWLKGRSFIDVIEEALKAGVTFLHYVKKTLTTVPSLRLQEK